MNRLRNHGQRILVATVVAAATLWPAIEVLAQNAAPPQPALRKTPPVWMGMGIMFILFAAVIALNLMPSKRGHQD